MASPSRISAWQPADVGDETDPGMAITTLPSSPAVEAVFRALLRPPASTTTVAAVRAARSLFWTSNQCLAGGVPGEYSLTSAPVNRDLVQQGCVRRRVLDVDSAGKHASPPTWRC